MPLYFADGVVHGATFATQDIRRFDDLQIATLKSIAAPLARAVETINAAIWLSDLRGFTTLTERLAPQTLLDLLN